LVESFAVQTEDAFLNFAVSSLEKAGMSEFRRMKKEKKEKVKGMPG
jgi:hypothetical protein